MCRISVDCIREIKASIPSLNRVAPNQVLRDGVLVRFRCMVQDNLDKVLKHKRVGEVDLKYRRGLEGVSTAGQFSREYYDVERFVVVSVPGEALEPVSEDLVPLYVSGVSDKRDRPEEMADETVPPKRVRECVDGEEPPAMIPVSIAADAEPSASPTPTVPHPIPDELVSAEVASRRVSAVLNMCDMNCELKLHDVVEVIGIASKLVPEDCLGFPICDYSIEVIDVLRVFEPQVDALTQEQAGIARSALKTVLARLLGDDQVAAEYLLLQLVSSRVAGNEALPTLGSWGLCLSNADTVNVKLLSQFIEAVVDGSFVSLETSNSVLSSEKFYPVRPVESDFTHAGILQLPSNSTVVLDERALGEGPVNALNILALTKAVREQEIMGVFGSSDIINFKLDCRFVILNSGTNKSIFGNTNPAYGVLGSSPFVTVDVRPTGAQELTQTDICLSESDLKAIRTYVRTTKTLVGKVSITEPVIEQFQIDWVESRKNDNSIPTEDIDAWATLLRVLAASHGSTETSMDEWKSVIQLEAERRIRNPRPSAKIQQVNQTTDPVVTGA